MSQMSRADGAAFTNGVKIHRRDIINRALKVGIPFSGIAMFVGVPTRDVVYMWANSKHTDGLDNLARHEAAIRELLPKCTSAEVARRYGVHERAIRRYREQLPPRFAPPAKRSAYPPELHARALELAREGMANTAIVRAVRCEFGGVADSLKAPTVGQWKFRAGMRVGA